MSSSFHWGTVPKEPQDLLVCAHPKLATLLSTKVDRRMWQDPHHGFKDQKLVHRGRTVESTRHVRLDGILHKEKPKSHVRTGHTTEAVSGHTTEAVSGHTT